MHKFKQPLLLSEKAKDNAEKSLHTLLSSTSPPRKKEDKNMPILNTTDLKSNHGKDNIHHNKTSQNLIYPTSSPSTSSISTLPRDPNLQTQPLQSPILATEPQNPIKSSVIPAVKKIDKLVYKYAKEAILKGISVGTKAFKNYLKNRIEQTTTPSEAIDLAISSADYSQLTECYIKDGKVIAEESQKYTLTLHAKERISKPVLNNVTLLFNKYSAQAKREGIKGDKKLLPYLKEKIQPRGITKNTIDDAINTGSCKKLTGKRLKYSKNDIIVIVSERNHSIITAYQRDANKR